MSEKEEKEKIKLAKKIFIILFVIILLVNYINLVKSEGNTKENTESNTNILENLYITRYTKTTILSKKDYIVETILEYRNISDKSLDVLVELGVSHAPDEEVTWTELKWSPLGKDEWNVVPGDSAKIEVPAHIEPGSSEGFIIKTTYEWDLTIDGKRKFEHKTETTGFSKSVLEIRIPLREGFLHLRKLDFVNCKHPPDYDQSDEYYRTLRWENPVPMLEEGRLINEINVVYGYKLDLISMLKYIIGGLIWALIIPLLQKINKIWKRKKTQRRK